MEQEAVTRHGGGSDTVHSHGVRASGIGDAAPFDRTLWVWYYAQGQNGGQRLSWVVWVVRGERLSSFNTMLMLHTPHARRVRLTGCCAKKPVKSYTSPSTMTQQDASELWTATSAGVNCLDIPRPFEIRNGVM